MAATTTPPLSKQTAIVDEQGRPTQYFFNLWQQTFTGLYTGTITTAPLTGGGTSGSMEFIQGRLVSVRNAT